MNNKTETFVLIDALFNQVSPSEIKNLFFEGDL